MEGGERLGEGLVDEEEGGRIDYDIITLLREHLTDGCMYEFSGLV